MWSSGATLLALLLVSVRPALGDACVLTVGSLYQLKSDAVDWTMRTSSGQSCIRGLRHNRVTIDTAKLISPPQSGQVKLLGPGFSYTAKSDFEGQDSFTIQVSGMLNGVRGSSDIRIVVLVGPNVSPQTSPTERSDRPPGDLRCSGSGTAWSCGAGTTSSQLSTALNNAADGATITFAAGSYSWNSFVSFDNSKGATLICATVGACNVTIRGTLGMNGNLSGANNHFYRISGFNFNASGVRAGAFVIWFWGPGVLQQLRIDHNTFTNTPVGNTVMVFGENSTVASFYGVVDHNTFSSSSGSISAFLYLGNVNPSPPPSPAGTANNLFFEDNTINITTMTNAGLSCMDGWGGNAVVYRHNTSTNCLVATHGATHAGGPPNIELYNNNIIVDSGSAGQGFSDCYRCFHHQGSGEFYAFNNSFTASGGKNGTVIGMMDYRAYANSIDGGAPICDGTNTAAFADGGHDGNRSPTATYRGYPCWHQPGRDFAISPAGGNLKPMYVWNNFWSDTLAQVPMTMEDLGRSPDYVPQHEQANRDYYNAVSASAQTSPTSPFDGTAGMGFGTLANRPLTCTTNLSETGGGVGYFATDQGAQGTLYRCSATNTWTVHYAPYAYPHPLVNGS